MKDKTDDLIDMFKSNAKPVNTGAKANVKGDKNIVFLDSAQMNGDININTKKIIKSEFKPNDTHITEEQAFNIKTLIDNLVLKEKASGNDTSASYSKWYSILKKHFKVTTYKGLPAARYDEAISFLKKQSAINRKKIYHKNPDMYKNELYAGIYARSKELGLSKADVFKIANDKFEKDISSLTQLSKVNLKKLYEYIFSLKK